ncbi:uncharacterized mitochondrial protein AtMg00810-like [Phragmites australis]|uniref:uncharacterized mitochondrial protein AtMg00810-like n=1 Tax=Phragmites australis TaxID=29695 RepID=UPI002D78CB04|nr:uncharacterized mitochondrial protein AtMg00810-like [Phragmites australis]
MVDASEFHSIVGCLCYLMNTRLDIAYAVGIVSRCMEKPTTQHMSTAKHLLWYVSGMISFGCQYKMQETRIQTLIDYIDIDLARDTDDQKSTTIMAFFFGLSLIIWALQMQKIMVLSSCEAKMDVDHVGTREQLANVLTKSPGRFNFIKLREKMGVTKERVVHHG